MLINFPALVASSVAARHPASASHALAHRAPRFPTGMVAQRIREINNGTFGKVDPTRSDKKLNTGLRDRLQPLLLVRNKATSPLGRATSRSQPATTRPEIFPRFIKHSVTGSPPRSPSVVQSRVEHRDRAKHQVFATQPMSQEQGYPPPLRRERHPLALLTLLTHTSSAQHASPSNDIDPLESQGMTHVSIVDGTGQGGVDNDTIPADSRSKACSATESDDESGWGSDFDDCDSDDDLSSEDEGPPLHSPAYFADLEKRLKAALPFLPRNRASDETMTRAFLQSRSDSDTGYASAPGTPGPDEGQLRDIVKDVREEFARLDRRALQAYDGMPDAEKQMPVPPRSPTFAEMIKHGREALKTRTHPNQPPRPTTAMDDLLDEVQNFKLEDLKPVNSSAPQINKIRVAPTDAGRKVNTTDLLRQLMEKMPDPDI